MSAQLAGTALEPRVGIARLLLFIRQVNIETQPLVVPSLAKAGDGGIHGHRAVARHVVAMHVYPACDSVNAMASIKITATTNNNSTAAILHLPVKATAALPLVNTIVVGGQAAI